MRISLTLAIFMILSTVLHAQTDTLRTDIIDVIKPFKATLSESIKIQSNPNPEIPEVRKPEFSYKLPEIKHNDIPTIYTIKPLSLGTALLPKIKNNYTRLGFGNYSMPLAEIYLNSKRNKNYQLGAFYKHLSADAENLQQFSNNTAGVYAKRFVDKGVVESDFLYHRNVVNLYGAKPTDITSNADLLRNEFGLFQLGAAYGNVQKDTSKLMYKIGLKYYNYSTNRDIDENDFILSGDFRKSIQGNPLNVYTAIQQNNTNTPTLNYNRVFVDVNPNYSLNISSKFNLNLGFNSTFFNDSNGLKYHFFPVADVAYQIIPRSLTVFGGITGNLQRNTLRSITTENAFVRGLSLENTLNQFESFIGFRGLISAQTSFLVRTSWSTIQNMLFYGSDSSLASQYTVYDNSSAGLFRFTAELNHEFYEHFHLGFTANYYGYDLSISAPFSRPTFTTSTNLLYNISNKFLLRGEAFTWDKRTVQLNNSNVEASINSFVDLNIGIEYRYSKTVALFLNLNNLTNNKYQRWFALPVYGFNILGGLAVSF